MNSTIPNTHEPRIAIVGSGPSAFYACEELLRQPHAVQVDMFERLPVPFGLVRHGVAPDHPKLKSVAAYFERIADHPAFTFIGNVDIGVDITVEQLRDCYHAVIFATGAERGVELGIRGENLAGCCTATEFVGWYNGHPGYTHKRFDLSHRAAVIIGQGNVALDVARILAKSHHELKATDIADHALDALATSQIREIYVIGRRGPAQAKFSDRALSEFLKLDDCVAHADPADLQLGPACQHELRAEANSMPRKNYTILQSFLESTSSKTKICHFRFFYSPLAIVGDRKVEGIVLQRNDLHGPPFSQTSSRLGKTTEIQCGTVISCIGHRSRCIDGLTYDPANGSVENDAGRVLRKGKPLQGIYVTGWAKRGARGTIGVNRGDSRATVNAILADLSHLPLPTKDPDSLRCVLAEKAHITVGLPGWQRIDTAERSRGAAQSPSRPRRKFTTVTELLAAAI